MEKHLTSPSTVEAVAYGATIQAAILKGDQEVLDLVLVDVIPMSLGWESRSGNMQIMLKKNTQIPAQRTFTSSPKLRTGHKYSKGVFEGERVLATENLRLGTVVVKTKPGDISSSETNFEVDTNGILTVTYRNLGTGDSEQIEMTRVSSTLSKEEIETLQKNAKVNQHDDVKEVNRLREKNKLNTMLVNIQYTMNTNENMLALDDQSKEKIHTKCKSAQDWMNANQDASTEAFKKKFSDLVSSWKLTLSHAPTLPKLPGVLYLYNVVVIKLVSSSFQMKLNGGKKMKFSRLFLSMRHQETCSLKENFTQKHSIYMEKLSVLPVTKDLWGGYPLRC